MYYVDRYAGEVVREKDIFAAPERYYEYRKGTSNDIIIETYVKSYNPLQLIDFARPVQSNILSDADKKLRTCRNPKRESFPVRRKLTFCKKRVKRIFFIRFIIYFFTVLWYTILCKKSHTSHIVCELIKGVVYNESYGRYHIKRRSCAYYKKRR